MTPPRLTELECPECHTTKWIIDSDYQGADLFGGIELAYSERVYSCSVCDTDQIGWLVRQQAPPEFLLQPHDLYPMTQAELGSRFFPRTPEEVAAKREAFERDCRSSEEMEAC